MEWKWPACLTLTGIISIFAALIFIYVYGHDTHTPKSRKKTIEYPTDHHPPLAPRARRHHPIDYPPQCLADNLPPLTCHIEPPPNDWKYVLEYADLDFDKFKAGRSESEINAWAETHIRKLMVGSDKQHWMDGVIVKINDVRSGSIVIIYEISFPEEGKGSIPDSSVPEKLRDAAKEITKNAQREEFGIPQDGKTYTGYNQLAKTRRLSPKLSPKPVTESAASTAKVVVSPPTLPKFPIDDWVGKYTKTQQIGKYNVCKKEGTNQYIAFSSDNIGALFVMVNGENDIVVWQCSKANECAKLKKKIDDEPKELNGEELKFMKQAIATSETDAAALESDIEKFKKEFGKQPPPELPKTPPIVIETHIEAPQPPIVTVRPTDDVRFKAAAWTDILMHPIAISQKMDGFTVSLFKEDKDNYGMIAVDDTALFLMKTGADDTVWKCSTVDCRKIIDALKSQTNIDASTFSDIAASKFQKVDETQIKQLFEEAKKKFEFHVDAWTGKYTKTEKIDKYDVWKKDAKDQYIAFKESEGKIEAWFVMKNGDDDQIVWECSNAAKCAELKSNIVGAAKELKLTALQFPQPPIAINNEEVKALLKQQTGLQPIAKSQVMDGFTVNLFKKDNDNYGMIAFPENDDDIQALFLMQTGSQESVWKCLKSKDCVIEEARRSKIDMGTFRAELQGLEEVMEEDGNDTKRLFKKAMEKFEFDPSKWTGKCAKTQKIGDYIVYNKESNQYIAIKQQSPENIEAWFGKYNGANDIVVWQCLDKCDAKELKKKIDTKGIEETDFKFPKQPIAINNEDVKVLFLGQFSHSDWIGKYTKTQKVGDKYDVCKKEGNNQYIALECII